MIKSGKPFQMQEYVRRGAAGRLGRAGHDYYQTAARARRRRSQSADRCTGSCTYSCTDPEPTLNRLLNRPRGTPHHMPLRLWERVSWTYGFRRRSARRRADPGNFLRRF